MSALDAWKSKAVHDVTLKSGTNVGLRLPNIRDCIIAGDIPLAVVDKMQKSVTATNGDAPELTLEDLQHDARFQAEMVARAIATIDGESVSLTVADIPELPEEDRDEIWGYASRTTALPLAS